LTMKRDGFIILFGCIYILGAIRLLLTLGVEQEIGLSIGFEVPYISEVLVRIVIAIFSIIMVYGYLKMKKWGYWSMMIYLILFLIISLTQIIVCVNNIQPFVWNAMFSVIVLIYTFIKRKLWINE